MFLINFFFFLLWFYTKRKYKQKEINCFYLTDRISCFQLILFFCLDFFRFFFNAFLIISVKINNFYLVSIRQRKSDNWNWLKTEQQFKFNIYLCVSFRWWFIRLLFKITNYACKKNKQKTLNCSKKKKTANVNQ